MSRSDVARRRDPDLPDLSGILVIDKPAGLTSHDVVARVRRLIGMKRVGHAGTLDPFATGVLVVAVGRSTRLLQYVQAGDKGYRARIALGVETDTGDIEGAVVRRGAFDAWPSTDDVAAVVRSFIGTIEQVPPVYSAIKVGGRKLYEMARAGEEVEAPTRHVRVDAIEIEAYEPPHLDISVVCGTGTYIRSLARDIGNALGTAGHCATLQRTNVGNFCLADAWPLDELMTLDARERWPEIALAPDLAIQNLAAVVLGGDDSVSWYHGRSVRIAETMDAGSVLRVYVGDGRFAGIGKVDDDGHLRPSLVMPIEQVGADVASGVIASDEVLESDE